MRVDAALVRDGLARSRRHATELVAAGRVLVDGRVVRRGSVALPEGGAVQVVADPSDEGWASRGAHKLVGGLDDLGVSVEGRVCLDAGASTGGFTDVLLRRGARRVVAVDVGHGQIVDRLRTDPRVEVREGVNVRELTAGDVRPAPDLVVGDLSFISLRLALAALVAVAAPGADLVLLVKPQFEVGRERLGSGGVVRDAGLRAEAVTGVLDEAADRGLAVLGVRRSRLPGPSGNVEYVVHLRVGADAADGSGQDGAQGPVMLSREQWRRQVQDAVVGGGA